MKHSVLVGRIWAALDALYDWKAALARGEAADCSARVRANAMAAFRQHARFAQQGQRMVRENVEAARAWYNVTRTSDRAELTKRVAAAVLLSAKTNPRVKEYVYGHSSCATDTPHHLHPDPEAVEGTA